jgi:tripartite ATP-independent transporter DctM subunit
MLRKIENAVCYISLILLTLLPLASSFARVAFDGLIPAGPETINHLLLVVGLLSGMICTREKQHLSIGLYNFVKDERARHILSAAANMVAAFITVVLFWCSASFIRVALSPMQWIGVIPDRVYALVMPIGYLVISWRFARDAAADFATSGLGKVIAVILPLLTVIAGCVCGLPAIVKLIWGLNLPDPAYDLIDWFGTAAGALRLPLILLLIAAALIGTPLFTIIGGLAMLLIQSTGGEIDISANQIYTGLTQSSLVPIALFTLTGFILSESRAGERLIEAFRAWFGWLPGGMIIVTVILCAFFTSFTGASGVTILALGGVLLAVLKDYPEKFKIGLLTASGSIGLMFPPSLPMLLVSATTRTNTLSLFLGGFLPGVLLIVAVIIFGIVVSVQTKTNREHFNLRRAGRGLWSALAEILLPLLLIAGYFTGILSLVEVSAASAAYVFVVEVLVRREITLKGMIKVLAKSAPIIGGILSILALAQALSYYILDSQAPVYFAQWVKGIVASKWFFLLLLNAALLITGCLVDIFSAIMIILPLLMPLGAAYGIDQVHMGVIFLINMEAGYLTPPVGLNLFLASYRFEKPFTKTARYALPFLLIELVVVLLVTYIPPITTWLPSLVHWHG